jgi:hypothetical protein
MPANIVNRTVHFRKENSNGTIKAARKTAHMCKRDISWLGYVIKNGGSIWGQMTYTTDRLSRKPYKQDCHNMGETEYSCC